MAVTIDTVYQRVLAIANKEQRGYLTPQEFNLLANQAQMDIFEQYFYDLNQFGRIKRNKTEYSDMVDIINEKLKPFQQWRTVMSVSSGSVGTLATDLHKLGKVVFTGRSATGSAASSFLLEIEEVQPNDLAILEMSPLTRSTEERPYFVRKTASTIDLYPTSTFASSSAVNYNYIKKPTEAVWGYVVVKNEALHDSNSATDFELHASEETELVIKILSLAGITIKDPSLYQVGDKEEIEKIQQEKL